MKDYFNTLILIMAFISFLTALLVYSLIAFGLWGILIYFVTSVIIIIPLSKHLDKFIKQ